MTHPDLVPDKFYLYEFKLRKDETCGFTVDTAPPLASSLASIASRAAVQHDTTIHRTTPHVRLLGPVRSQGRPLEAWSSFDAEVKNDF